MSLSFDASSLLPVLTHQLVLVPFPEKDVFFFRGTTAISSFFFFFDWSNKSRKRELFGFSPSDVRRRQIEPVSHHKMLTLHQDWKTPPLFFQESRNLKVKGQGRTKGVSCSGHVLIPWCFFFFFSILFCSAKGHHTPDRT